MTRFNHDLLHEGPSGVRALSLTWFVQSCEPLGAGAPRAALTILNSLKGFSQLAVDSADPAAPAVPGPLVPPK